MEREPEHKVDRNCGRSLAELLAHTRDIIEGYYLKVIEIFALIILSFFHVLKFLCPPFWNDKFGFMEELYKIYADQSGRKV
jgi:hypothetical protein